MFKQHINTPRYSKDAATKAYVDATFSRVKAGASSSVFDYRVDTTTTSAGDPGGGKFRYSDAGQKGAVRYLYMDWITQDGFDVVALFTAMKFNDTFIIQDKDMSLQFQKWRLLGPAVNMPDYFVVEVEFLEGDTVFSNNQLVSFVVMFMGQEGEVGDVGPQGPPGPQGASGPGVPAGGTANQVLTKIDSADFNTQWSVQSGGATQSYVDTQDALRVAKTGDTMTGALSINSPSVGYLPFSIRAVDGMYKYLRVNNGGELAIINSNNTSQILTLSDTGALNTAGRITGNGLTSINGITMGSDTAPGGAADLSRHLSLWGTAYGMSVTGGSLNLVSNSAATVQITSGGATVNGTLTVTGASTLSGTVSANRINSWGSMKACGWAGQANLGLIFLNNNEDRYLHYDGSNYTFYAAHVYSAAGRLWGTGDGTPYWSGAKIHTGPSYGAIQWDQGNNSIEVRSNGGNMDGAFMSFHRQNYWASYFGVDYDNQWAVGGWSAGAVRYRIWHEGNINPVAHGSNPTFSDCYTNNYFHSNGNHYFMAGDGVWIRWNGGIGRIDFSHGLQTGYIEGSHTYMYAWINCDSFTMRSNSISLGDTCTFGDSSLGAFHHPRIHQTTNGVNGSWTSSYHVQSISGRRYKKDIKPLKDIDAAVILKLQPISFKANTEICTLDDPDEEHLGFIAEDVAEIEPRLVQFEFPREDLIENPRDGMLKPLYREGSKKVANYVEYDRISVLLVMLAKQHEERIKQLEGKLNGNVSV